MTTLAVFSVLISSFGQQTADDCGIGSYFDQNDSTCKNCPEGKYQNQRKRTACHDYVMGEPGNTFTCEDIPLFTLATPDHVVKTYQPYSEQERPLRYYRSKPQTADERRKFGPQCMCPQGYVTSYDTTKNFNNLDATQTLQYSYSYAFAYVDASSNTAGYANPQPGQCQVNSWRQYPLSNDFIYSSRYYSLADTLRYITRETGEPTFCRTPESIGCANVFNVFIMYYILL